MKDVIKLGITGGLLALLLGVAYKTRAKGLEAATAAHVSLALFDMESQPVKATLLGGGVYTAVVTVKNTSVNQLGNLAPATFTVMIGGTEISSSGIGLDYASLILSGQVFAAGETKTFNFTFTVSRFLGTITINLWVKVLDINGVQVATAQVSATATEAQSVYSATASITV